MTDATAPGLRDRSATKTASDSPPAKVPNMATVTSTETEATPAMSPSTPDIRPVRRAVTVDVGSEQAQLRRRAINPQSTPETPFGEFRRRSSTFSDYSLDAARRSLQHEILNPASFASDEQGASESSTMPLAFALLPAVAGMFHHKGSDFITDIIMIVLAAVFLHWSLTVPWNMYKAAQQVRIENEQLAESALDEDGTSPTVTPLQSPSAEVQEPRTPIESKHTTSSSEEDARPPSPEIPAQQHKHHSSRHARRVHKALGELYTIESLALVLCFVSPLIMAYLLQIMRNQFKSEGGLVSDFSLTLYILAAEVRPFSHLIKLIQARTLHLQRIVHQNPYSESVVPPTRLQEILERLNELEQRAAGSKPSNGSANPHNNGQSDGSEGDQGQQQNLNPKVRDGMVREVRNTIQPDLDALNRAVRRYEKKATVLAYQTEARLGALDGRLNDAIALAAAAAKAGGTGARPHGNNSRANGATGFDGGFGLLGMLAKALDTIVWAAVMPFQALLGFVVLFPLRAVAGFLKGVTGGSSKSRVAVGKVSGTGSVGGARKGMNGNGYATAPGNSTGYPPYAGGGAEYGYSASGRRTTSGSGSGARYPRR
ncbi:hypothetical protein QBC32DRAFT_10868 [Pseudoneurospora amorphoporcata]|uniref:Uncharacterized protein n=1 Tax=Pseudoneurospora amorphoporcata TaxID=241081 RepID=A0AAN6NT62_9PEZI|nr:hypothetical protein QBC32DRAFT_10868 [Pseudoneurospora amorphoporcata]